MAVLSTFCVDDTRVSTQHRLTTKDTRHMKGNAWPGQNKNNRKCESKEASVTVYKV